LIAEFSKLKIISGPHFIDFRRFFKAKYLKGFIVPANTFDNVKGQFPIGFMIWDTAQKEQIMSILTDVYEKNGAKIEPKTFHSYDDSQYMNEWVKPFRADPKKNQLIGKFPFKGNDFQNQNMIQLVHHKMEYNTEAGQFLVNQKNVMQACVYLAVKKAIPASWLNDRDQFLAPNKGWETDMMFQSNCLAFVLFTNNIQSRYGTNHWIPFTEHEVNAREKIESNFMSKYISGKVNTEITFDLFGKVEKDDQRPIQFAAEAQAVLRVGRNLWAYYHQQPNCNVNASLYDIKEHFQGRSESGKMNNKSLDETYTSLMNELREALKQLAQKIEYKVYDYGFLKQ
jgi:hypothetical protein